MKFKTDENLPSEAADLLRSAGHDAVMVDEMTRPPHGLERINWVEAIWQAKERAARG
jgi:predicted nuclease of predicted toxin-antitoxin system